MFLLTLLMACSSEPAPNRAVEAEPASGPLAPVPIEEPGVEVAPSPEELVPQPEGSVDPEPPQEPPAPEANVTSTAEPEPTPAPAADPEAAPAEVVQGEETPEAPTAEAPSAPEPTGPVHYALETGSSSLYVQVFKDTTTAASGISHDHVMRASGWSGTATWDPGNPSACKIDISVPVDKLVVDPAKLREAVGYEATLSDGQRGDVRKNMLSKDQLNASAYPSISFQATGCKVVGPDKVDVSGELTLKGTTKPVTLRMTWSADAESFSASGGFKIQGSDYGLEPYSAMMGALKNQDELRFTVRLSGAVL